MRGLRRASRRHIDWRGTELAGWLVAGGVLELAAATGLAYVAGFWAVLDAFARMPGRWPWLMAMLGALGTSFAGYYYAYQGIYHAEGGYELTGRQMRALVAAAFGGLLAQGGTTPDDLALQAAGAGRRDALVRVGALGGAEQGVLAIGGWAASIAVLLLGLSLPPADFTLPWVIVPVPAAALVLWLAGRYAGRLRRYGGWRGTLSVLLDAFLLTRTIFSRPLQNGYALAAMALFWAGDAFAVWTALAVFGLRMDGAAFVVGYCTGMVLTRRTAPLAGAGILMLILPVTRWYSSAPLAVAVAGVFAYRVLSIWVPMPFALAGLPVLRGIARQTVPSHDDLGPQDGPGGPGGPGGTGGAGGPGGRGAHGIVPGVPKPASRRDSGTA